MGVRLKIALIFSSIFLLVCYITGNAQEVDPDSVVIKEVPTGKYDQFYDSLEYKAKRSKITSLFYDLMISNPKENIDHRSLSLSYYNKMKGKIISDIDITPLEVFGPTFEDTTRKAKGWLERTANAIHTKSNLNTIRKMLLFKVGDAVNPDLMYENERIIRSLPYIKDVRFILEQDSVYTDLVRVHVITQDRFSLGASGGVNGTSSAALEVYNQNIFGVGQEISFRFVGHVHRQPYMGLETFYKINNVRGKFINIAAGYMNTYEKEGFSFMLNKPFITPSMKWGYGASALRMYRTNRLFENDPVMTTEPLNLSYFSVWGGHSFQFHPNQYNNSQMVVSAGIYNRTFFHRPTPSPFENQYFSNSTFYMASLTFTQRRFVQDQLVYSYGIVEDIPEGFKNEIVYGFDANEFGNRHYLHIYLSNGNFLVNRQGYLYLSAGIGGYFNELKHEQGLIQGNLSFISRQINAGRKRFRLFVRSNYMLGIRRFDIENLDLERHHIIRGFSSDEAVGKQRLSLDLEYVLFLRRELYRFNMAVFGFGDLGIIGSNKQLIFTENYYSGIGLGLRLHNESLVFKTFQLRLAFYPFHPKDMDFVGFILSEQLKKNYYSFEPTAPRPLDFE